MQIPDYLTYFFRERQTPFEVLSDLEEPVAQNILTQDTHWRGDGTYLAYRKQHERLLREKFIAKGGRSKRQYPIYMILGDSPVVGVIMYPECGKWSLKSAPEFDEKMNYIHTNNENKIRVYENIDPRFILEDFYAKLSQFNKGHYDSNIIIKTMPVKL